MNPQNIKRVAFLAERLSDLEEWLKNKSSVSVCRMVYKVRPMGFVNEDPATHTTELDHDLAQEVVRSQISRVKAEMMTLGVVFPEKK